MLSPQIKENTRQRLLLVIFVLGLALNGTVILSLILGSWLVDFAIIVSIITIPLIAALVIKWPPAHGLIIFNALYLIGFNLSVLLMTVGASWDGGQTSFIPLLISIIFTILITHLLNRAKVVTTRIGS